MRRWLAFDRIGGVYVLLAIIAVFGFLEPDQYLTAQTAKTVLNQYALTGLFALSLVVPLAAGVFDLSVAAQAGLANVLVAAFVAQDGMSAPMAIGLVLLIGVGVGLANAFVVVVLRIDSFIATLGTGAIIGALTVAASANKTITGEAISGSFQQNLALRNLDGVTIPVLFLLVLMVVIGLVLEQTQTGRHWYAVGFDADTARLAGVSVGRLQTLALVTSALVASFAGIVLTARIASGTPGSGASYLLPAFAAAFLGATQLRHGRFNTWGTVLAVLLLGAGTYGLVIADAPDWAPQAFEGVVLIAAVALTNLERGRLSRHAVFSRLRRRQRGDGAGAPSRPDGGASPADRPADHSDDGNPVVAPVAPSVSAP
jgi:ribose transport system permease protein